MKNLQETLLGRIKEDLFICLDLETTGLNLETDRIIECAVVLFNFENEKIACWESLIDPGIEIPEASKAFHGISDEMVHGRPTIDRVLPEIFEFMKDYIVIGHGINFDLAFLNAAAKRAGIKLDFAKNPTIDTLRLARLYGKSPSNALQVLREHFEIKEEGAHRAMGDVIVNIKVFKKLVEKFITTESVFQRLELPILLKTMPFGQYQGEPMSKIPLYYLQGLLKKEFDKDLTFTIKTAIERCKR